MADGSGSDGGDPGTTRRRFLKATGAASVTAALAGCPGDGSGATTTDGPATTRDTSTTGDPTTTTAADSGEADTTAFVPLLETYPYGIGETQIQHARKTMEDAGYGPDDRFELEWLQGSSDTEAVDALDARLDPAHVDISVRSRIEVERAAEAGRVDAFLYGWIADYPAPESFLRGVYPPNTDYDADGATGAPLFWTPDSHHESGREWAIEQFERIRAAPEPTDEAAAVRDDAVRNIEEALWEDVPLLPVAHGVEELVWYDRVDWDPPGAMGGARQKHDRIAVSGEDHLSLVGESRPRLDPIRWGQDVSDAIVTDLHDTLTTFRNATTAVEPLLIDGYETSDDFTTYTFTLTEGVRFHDGSELTAADVVYSLRRLAESEHGHRADLLTRALGVVHEPVEDDDTDRARPGTLGVRATGTYEVELDLRGPSAHALSILALPGCSIVPEGIVGDVEGYDGRITQEAFATGGAVGCGPFQLGEYTPSESVTVERFPDYHGQYAKVEAVEWRIVVSNDEVYDRFVAGDSDITNLWDVPAEQYAREKVTVRETDARGRERGTYGPLPDGETVNYARIPGLSTFYIGFNCERVPVPVRRAVAYAMNEPRFSETLWAGKRVRPAYLLTPPALFPGGPDAYTDYYQAH